MRNFAIFLTSALARRAYVSAAASSRGVAVYYQANQVYAIRLEPVPTSAPATTRPPVVVFQPPTVEVSGATISFSVPKSCVPAGSTFRVTR